MKNLNNYFKKAIDYYKNAKEIIKNIPIEYGFYKNQKTVQKSAGICYLALDNAVKGFLINKGMDKKKVLSSTWDGLKSMLLKCYPSNGKFRENLETAYSVVHISIYYHGETKVDFVKIGYQAVKYVIEKLAGIKIQGGIDEKNY